MKYTYIFIIVFISSIVKIKYGNASVTIGGTDKPVIGPVITKQPVDVLYDEARGKLGTVEFVVEAVGHPPLTYQWYFFRRPVDLNDRAIKVSNGSLKITWPWKTKHEGAYLCRVENSVGAVLSNPAQLKLRYLNDFNTYNAPARTPVTANVNFGAALECHPPKTNYSTLVFSWYKTSVDNVITPNNRTFVSSDGRLYFQSVSRDDAGDYYCVVSPPNVPSNSSLRKTSLAIPLRVMETVSTPPPPEIRADFPKIFPGVPRVGEEVRLECFAFGFGTLSYEWTLYGKPFPTDVIHSDNNRVITISKVGMEHEGFYICSENSTGREIMFNAVELVVKSPPYFTSSLQAGQSSEGSGVDLSCVADGSPDITYKWYRNATEIDLSTKSANDRIRYTIFGNHLIIRNIQNSDASMYQCSAVNLYGQVFSSAQLDVAAAPPTTKPPFKYDYYGRVGDSVTLLCGVATQSEYKKTWFKYDQIITTGNYNKAHYWQLMDGDLRISDLTRDDEGNYTCELRDAEGALAHIYTRTLSIILTDAPSTTWKIAVIVPCVIVSVVIIVGLSLALFLWRSRDSKTVRYGGVKEAPLNNFKHTGAKNNGIYVL